MSAAPPTPPAPPGWNKTVRDLFDEMGRGLRSSVGWPEDEWALDHERSLLPPGTRYPREGDVYVSQRPVRVVLLVYWRSPSTTDVECTLPAGCRLRVEHAAADRPLTVLAMPLDVKAVEKAALSVWTRIRPDYRGCGVSLNTSEIVRSFGLEPHQEATR